MPLGQEEQNFERPVISSHVLHGPQPPPCTSTIPKRLKACLGCRELKLRCQRNEVHPELGCERCAAAGRECIIPEGKRHKRPGSSAVAILERKIDALVASLGELRKESEYGNEENLRHNAEPFITEPVDMQALPERTGAKRALPDDTDSVLGLSSGPSFTSSETEDRSRKRIHTAKQELFSFFAPRAARTDELFQSDVVHRGLMSAEDAERVFHRFTTCMLPHFACVAFPQGTTAFHVRRTKPALFLAILGAASSILGAEVQRVLAKEVMLSYADRLIIRGEKSLEIIQSILVSALWYYPPEHYEEVKFYQVIHIAAIMASELGFGQEFRPFISRLPPSGSFIPRHVHGLTSRTDASVDGQRAWLSCYVLCGIAAMTLRRPCLLRWTSYMDQCIASLESPPEAADADKLLCQYVRGQHLAEEIGLQFRMDDPSAKIDLLDVNVQYVLRGLEQQLHRWRTQVPLEVQKPTLHAFVNTVNLYLHEIVLHVGQNNMNDFKPPFIEESLHPPSSPENPPVYTTAHQNSLVVCITSAKNVLDIFSSLDTETLSSIPIFGFVRTAYSVVALMKVHLMALRSKEGPFSFIDTDDLEVEVYIDRILASLQTVIGARKLRLASIFHVVLEMLRSWFQTQCRVTSGDYQNDLQRPEPVRPGWNGHPGADRGGHPERPNTINSARQSDDTMMTFVNNGMAPSFLDSGPSLPENQPVDFGDIDFATLFYSDDGSLFETALGWFAGFM